MEPIYHGHNKSSDTDACIAGEEPGLYTTWLFFGCPEHRVLEMIKVLVNYGWDPLETSESGKTLLRAAVEQGFVSVTQYLLSLSISPSPDLLQVAPMSTGECSRS